MSQVPIFTKKERTYLLQKMPSSEKNLIIILDLAPIQSRQNSRKQRDTLDGSSRNYHNL